MSEWVLNAIWSIIPTAIVGLFFWFLLRTVLRADRVERREYARIEEEERRKFQETQLKGTTRE